MNWVDTNFELGNNFRKIREWQNLSRRQFAQMLNHSEQAYRHFEEGDVGIKVSDLLKFCKALDLDLVEVLQKDFIEKNMAKYVLKLHQKEKQNGKNM